jgi:hypothetical protein
MKMICKNCSKEIEPDKHRPGCFVHVSGGLINCNLIATPFTEVDRKLDAKQILADLDAREKSRRRQTTEPKVRRGLDDMLYRDAEVIE